MLYIFWKSCQFLINNSEIKKKKTNDENCGNKYCQKLYYGICAKGIVYYKMMES